MQNQIEKILPLLDETGNISEAGWATEPLWSYNRADIKTNKLRIKEWDYYLIYNKDFAVALTIADNGYMGLIGASIINLQVGKELTKNIMTFMPKGKFNLPTTTKNGNSIFKSTKAEIRFLNDGENRKLLFEIPNFENHKTLSGEITLYNEPKESLCIATPFKKPKHFYYNQKIIGFTADGSFKLGNKTIEFLPTDTVALLDWGRGVWTYSNTWYWGAAAGKIDNVDFGFNIGYGFGDTSKATENVVFYNGIAHKLDQVTFEIPKNTQNNKDDFMSKWHFSSNDDRFVMDFEPIVDRKSYNSALVIKSDQNQVFGKFNGYVILDDDTKIIVKDLIGFAEKVINKW